MRAAVTPIWRLFRAALIGLSIAVLSIASLLLAPAQAEQGSIVIPTAGPHSMTDLAQNYFNPAFRALLGQSSGATAPANGPSNAPLTYQLWVDTSTSPPTLRIYDGSQWAAIGTLNPATHTFAITAPLAVTAGTIDNVAIGATTPATAKVTNFTVTGAAALGSNATIAGGAINNTPIGQTSPAAGKFTVLNATGGTLDNVTVGATTPAPGTFNALTVPSGGTVSLPAASLIYANLPAIGSQQILGNIGGSGAAPAGLTLSALLTAIYGNTIGLELCQTASGTWGTIAPGTAGYVKTANGAGQCATYQAAPGGGAAAPRSAVRQTVQGGPSTSAGLPNVFAATSASLTPVMQNVSTTNPLTVSAAQGSNGTGQNDLVYQYTSNQTMAACPASGPCYEYANAQTGAFVASNLAPIEQCGGALSTASGQFSFDKCGGATGGSGTAAGQRMVGYMGNGSAAPATPLVPLGEWTAGALTLSAGVAYAYNGTYYGSQASLAAGGSYPASPAPNIGSRDVTVTWWMECTAVDQGYAVGDRVYNNELGWSNGGSTNYGLYLRTSGRNGATLFVGPSGIGLAPANGAGLTPGSWKAGYVIQKALQ